MKSRALVLGAGGQLGETMVAGLARSHEVVGLTRADLDVTASAPAAEAVSTICPAVIINCAAYNQVDAAEHNPLAALAANAWAVRTLARLATDVGATLVHFSTDFVFDGKTDRPYVETDLPNPQSAYASSKLLGDWFAMDTPQHYVLRVESLFGGVRARSSIDRIIDTIRSGAEVRAFVDRTVSPSYVDDVVGATAALLERDSPYGLYHCVNGGWTTWADLAREIARLLGRPDAHITDIRMTDAGLTAKRPQFAALSNAKLASAGVTMPTWQDAVGRYVGEKDV